MNSRGGRARVGERSGRRRRGPGRHARWAAALAAVVLLAGCGSTGPAPAAGSTASGAGAGKPADPAAASGAAAATAPAPASTPGKITVSTPYAAVGQAVHWQAQGLPAGRTLDLEWETAQGSWKLDGPNIVGDVYTFGKRQLGTVQSSAAGTASGQFAVPAGFGGVHNFGLALPSGTPEATAAVTVVLSASIDRTTAADGGFFTITVQGLGYGGGYNAYSAEYGVLYDNHYMGFISGVTTEGAATFRVRAEGVGSHVISIINSPLEGPYLNQQQSPYQWFGHFDWTVQVTAAVPQTVTDPVATLAKAQGQHLTVTPGSGYVGSSFTLAGSGLPADASLAVQWATESGNRVTAGLFATTTTTLTTVTTDAAGSFSDTLKVPVDLGGPAHAITLVDAGKVVGQASYRILPQLVGVAPEQVQEGQPFTVHLSGVGWTQFDNIYAVDYDDAYTGYGCGFNSAGDVQIVLRAAGPPGYHFIDLYPSPYKGATPLPNWYGMPQLTYAQDHPGESLPAFHVVIDVVQ